MYRTVIIHQHNAHQHFISYTEYILNSSSTDVIFLMEDESKVQHNKDQHSN